MKLYYQPVSYPVLNIAKSDGFERWPLWACGRRSCSRTSTRSTRRPPSSTLRNWPHLTSMNLYFVFRLWALILLKNSPRSLSKARNWCTSVAGDPWRADWSPACCPRGKPPAARVREPYARQRIPATGRQVPRDRSKVILHFSDCWTTKYRTLRPRNSGNRANNPRRTQGWPKPACSHRECTGTYTSTLWTVLPPGLGHDRISLQAKTIASIANSRIN